MSRLGTTIGAVAIVALLATPVAAQVFRWIDDQGNSHYAEGLLNVPERFRSRAEQLGLRSAPTPPPGASSPSSAAPPAAAGAAVIRFTPGNRIVVNVRLNDRASARLLIDTGADRTLISPLALSAAGVEMSRIVARGEMRGVTGSSEVVYVTLDSLHIDQARVDRLIVAAYEMGSREVDGLLGRDVLDQFNVSIDSSRGVVTLSPK